MMIPFIYSLRSVTQRPVSTALTALGIGLVGAMSVAMLALAKRFIDALVKTGSSDNVLLLWRGADTSWRAGFRATRSHIAEHLGAGTLAVLHVDVAR